MVVIRVEEDSHAVEDLDVAERRPEFVVLLGVPQREAVAEERLALAVDIELDGQLKGRALERPLVPEPSLLRLPVGGQPDVVVSDDGIPNEVPVRDRDTIAGE